MSRRIPGVDAELERRVEAMGFEVVQVEWAGSARRPVLRVRIDVGSPRALDGSSVTVGDCATVSRGLEAWLDASDEVPERYVLEVSSPGVERPLTRPGDWERFAGRQVAVKGKDVLAGRARRLEGELLGVTGGGGARVRLRLHGGDEVEIPKDEISGANLVFDMK